MSMVALNRVVKNIEFTSTDEEITNFKQFNGQNIILYFYPRDNTPGCTTESKEFKQYYKRFLDSGTVILGISRDSIASHEKFCDKFAFPFPLISDENEVLCEYFDVMKQKNMYGKKVRGIERSTFFIDKDRKLRHEWRKVKAEGHAKAVLDYVEAF